MLDMKKELSDMEQAAALKYRMLLETNNDIFMPLFFDHSRYLILKGGGGSGKSIFAGRKILERVTTERGHRFLVVRKVGRTIRDSCFNQLLGQLREYYPHVNYKANKSDMRMFFPDTGGEILFSGLDDVEKLKSIYNITGIWIEEASELLESDFNQLDIRLRGETPYYKQMILSFNPISILHWLKLRFFDRVPPDTMVSETTYQNNRFLDEEAKKVLEDFRYTDEYYYSVYCLGEWGVTGETVFPGRAVAERLQVIPKPLKVGYFDFEDDGLKISNIRWVDDEKGMIKIWKEPESGRPYVIGGDPAGDGSDRYILQCLDNISASQCATLKREKLGEDVYARQAYCLGMYYNTALIAIETNCSTYPVMELQRLKYKKQYVRETFDDYTHKPKAAYGFRTDAKTRPVIIAQLIKLIRDDIDIINDRDTLEEMMTFVRNEDYRPEAEEGAHDDCIMALAIAHFCGHQQKKYVMEHEDRVEWSESMKEDYRNGSAADREEMIKRWGRPKNV